MKYHLGAAHVITMLIDNADGRLSENALNALENAAEILLNEN